MMLRPGEVWESPELVNRVVVQCGLDVELALVEIKMIDNSVLTTIAISRFKSARAPLAKQARKYGTRKYRRVR